MKNIKPSSVQGTITAPSSKSDMLRAVAAAYLTRSECEILNPSSCDDARAAIRVAESLGTKVRETKHGIVFSPEEQTPNPLLDCGESGLCIRMFPAIAALREDEITLTGHGSLTSRPLSMLEQPLKDLGVTCRTHAGLLPVTIKGPLQAGRTTIDGSVTSQFLTGLLMALPLCEGESEVIVSHLKSKPYIEMTLNIMEAFGVHITNEHFERFLIPGCQHYHADSYCVEGDWSGAAFPLVAGAIAGNATVTNLSTTSRQADKMILEALKRCGAQLDIRDNAVEVRQQKLTGFEFDATDCPDLFPPLVTLAAFCEGKTIIHGAQRLKVKESDRGQALLTEFRKLGASIELFPDRMEVLGTQQLEGGAIDSYNDHRIAMAGAVAGLRSKRGVTIQGWECVAKSYPEFFDDCIRLGVTIE